MGRWINRDPIEENGGISVYFFVQNSPVNLFDSFGLTTRSDIQNDRLIYSCNCGWVDLGHYLPGGPKGLWNQMQAQKGDISATGKGFKITYGQKMGPDPGKKWWGFSLGYTRNYFVKFGLSLAEREGVALSIFKEVSEGFESMQGTFPISIVTRKSSYSEEDLVSDLIGFYRAVKGYTPTDILKFCHFLTKTESENVWDKTGGLQGIKTWVPIDHNDATGCCDGKMKWPTQLDSIKAVPKGDSWRNWYEKDIEIFK